MSCFLEDELTGLDTSEACGFDPVTLDEIPAERAIRLRCGPRKALQCFDVGSLYELVVRAHGRVVLNPLTREPLTASQVARVVRRANELGITLRGSTFAPARREENELSSSHRVNERNVYDPREVPQRTLPSFLIAGMERLRAQRLTRERHAAD